jgi:PAS domain S-box-containing protein
MGTDYKNQEKKFQKLNKEPGKRIQQSKIFEAFFTSTITPLVFLDKDFNFIRVNEAYAKACHRDVSEFPGHNHFEFYPHKENEAIFRQVVETKVPFQTFAKPFDFPDHPEWGTTYWDWTLTPILDKKREVESLVFSLNDVTDRKRAEEAAKTEHALRKSIENSILTGILVMDLNGHITHVNSAFYQMTGWSEEDLVGSVPPFTFMPPEYAETSSKEFSAILDGQFSMGTFEGRMRRKNKERFDALVSVSPLKDSQGETLGWVASVGNISERKATERRIRATNTLLNLIAKKSTRKGYLDEVVDLMHSWSRCHCVGIRVLDKQGFIPYESYIGFSQEFWESENRLSLERDQCLCIRVAAGNPDPQDIPVMTPAGSFYCGNTFEFIGYLSEEEKSRFRGVCIQNGFLSVSVVPIRYQEKILGAIHLADERERIITSRSMEFIESVAPLIGEAVNRFTLEEDLRKSENHLRLLSSQLLTIQENERKRISREVHDSLGQSLSTIKFRMEAALRQMREKGDKVIAKSLEPIMPIIQLSIEEARRIQMDLRPSVLDDLGILATLSWFCREFQDTYPGIQIEREVHIVEADVPENLKTVVYRILQEALNNIAKHSQADLVRLSLRKSKERVELKVQDNGVGFDLMKVAGSSARGFGLTSMQERAELSGGSYVIESRPGSGTVIRATWPI